jgi:hypothetical protein
MARVYAVGKPGEPKFPADYEIVKHNVLQWSDITKNHNKFYCLELHRGEENGKEFYRLFTHYGRTDDLITKGDKVRRGAREYWWRDLTVVHARSRSRVVGSRRVTLAVIWQRRKESTIDCLLKRLKRRCVGVLMAFVEPQT